MYGMGEQFLARTAFSQQEGCDIALCSYLGQLHGVDDDIRFAEYVGKTVTGFGTSGPHGEFLHSGSLGQSTDDTLVFGNEGRGENIAVLRVAHAQRHFLIHDVALAP